MRNAKLVIRKPVVVVEAFGIVIEVLGIANVGQMIVCLGSVGRIEGD